jgi:UDP-N-acetyl-2-amino-2-deoxyglucuronate dehydrogenase
MKTFALIGVAGYIAERHLKAIKATDNTLIAALDPFDSVGLMDRYFPDADFFTEFERFDRHLYKLKRQNQKVDYVSICSPNYLHDAHIRFALRNGADAICEKPLVLNPWNVEALKEYEHETGKRVFNVLQLRLHSSIIEFKRAIEQGLANKVYDVDLTYITSRGKWYLFSWKGDESKSGGIATNIGVHFFDMLGWIFGKLQHSTVHLRQDQKAAGFLQFEKARVRWFLSIDEHDLPNDIKTKGQRTYRSITIGQNELEFSEGFTDLHTHAYEHILSGQGYGLDDAAPCIELVHHIRNANIKPLVGDYHPFLKP